MIKREVIIGANEGYIAIDDGTDNVASGSPREGAIRIGCKRIDSYIELYITNNEWEDIKKIGDEYFEEKYHREANTMRAIDL